MKKLIMNNLPLSQSIALISKVEVFISNDSGLGHIASMFNKKQIVLFGATDPIYSRPCSSNVTVITPENFKPFYVPHKGIVDTVNYNINDISAEDILDAVKNNL